MWSPQASRAKFASQYQPPLNVHGQRLDGHLILITQWKVYFILNNIGSLALIPWISSFMASHYQKVVAKIFSDWWYPTCWHVRGTHSGLRGWWGRSTQCYTSTPSCPWRRAVIKTMHHFRDSGTPKCKSPTGTWDVSYLSGGPQARGMHVCGVYPLSLGQGGYSAWWTSNVMNAVTCVWLAPSYLYSVCFAVSGCEAGMIELVQNQDTGHFTDSVLLSQWVCVCMLCNFLRFLFFSFGENQINTTLPFLTSCLQSPQCPPTAWVLQPNNLLITEVHLKKRTKKSHFIQYQLWTWSKNTLQIVIKDDFSWKYCSFPRATWRTSVFMI